jgi:hypothetical protein
MVDRAAILDLVEDQLVAVVEIQDPIPTRSLISMRFS